MPREQQSNPTPNRISLNIITYRIGKEILKDVPPDERYPIFLQKVELMTYREDFIKEVLGLRNEFGIPKLGFDDFDTCIKWAEKITMEIELEYEHRVDDLFKHFNIKPRWKNIIGYFILFDNIDAPHLLPRSVEVCIKPDSLSERSVYIKIQPETTLEDIKNWWSIVQKWKGLLLTGRPLDSIDPLSPEYLKFTEQLPSPVENVHQQSSKKEKVRKSLLKYKQAYDLQKQGKTLKEITKIMNADKDKKSVYGYEDIADFIKQFKKTIKNNQLD